MSQKPPPKPRSTPRAAVTTIQAETQTSSSSLLDSQANAQESPLATSTHGVISQEPSHTTGILKASSQEPPSTLNTRRVSIQEPTPSSLSTRRVSIQEPTPSSLSGRRVSIQEPLPSSLSTRRVSIQEPLPILQSRRGSGQEPSLDSSHLWSSTQDTPSITYNSWVGARDQRLSLNSQINVENVRTTEPIAYPRIERPRQSFKQNRLSVNVPPSITRSPEASIKSIESIVWGSQESCKECGHSSQVSQITLDNIHTSGTISSTRFQDKWSRQSLLPIGWRLLHEAKKISRQLSLVLTLAGMVIISLISLGQPWMHFQVPLKPPGDPDGPPTIPIDTVFFMQCPDVICMYEYDQNAYLLDLSWTFLVISSITALCLCVALISTLFFTSSNLPMLDFFLFISSIMTGTALRPFPQDPRRGVSCPVLIMKPNPVSTILLTFIPNPNPISLQICNLSQ